VPFKCLIQIVREWLRKSGRGTETPEDETTNVIICTSRICVCVCVCVCVHIFVCVWCVHCFIVIIAIIVNNERTMFSVTTTIISVARVCRRRLVSVAPGGQSWTSRTAVRARSKTSFWLLSYQPLFFYRGINVFLPVFFFGWY